MMNNHLYTNVAAIMTLFVTLLLSGISASRLSFDVKFTEPVMQLLQNSSVEMQPNQQANEVQEIPAENKISSGLAVNLKKVFKVGKEIGHPETLQAILLQESQGGRLDQRIGNKEAPVGKRSYGVMQVQVVAARSVLSRDSKLFARYFPTRKYNKVADEEIIALLLTNDEANIRIAAHHFKLYVQLAGGNWAKAVAGYNAGIGNARKMANTEEYSYVLDIKSKIEERVKPFNQKNGLLTHDL